VVQLHSGSVTGVQSLVVQLHGGSGTRTPGETKYEKLITGTKQLAKQRRKKKKRRENLVASQYQSKLNIQQP
jgi:hypothetical protein